MVKDVTVVLSGVKGKGGGGGGYFTHLGQVVLW